MVSERDVWYTRGPRPFCDMSGRCEHSFSREINNFSVTRAWNNAWQQRVIDMWKTFVESQVYKLCRHGNYWLIRVELYGKQIRWLKRLSNFRVEKLRIQLNKAEWLWFCGIFRQIGAETGLLTSSKMRFINSVHAEYWMHCWICRRTVHTVYGMYCCHNILPV